MKKVLLATTNPAKIKYYKPRLEIMGAIVFVLDDFKLDKNIEETGSTPEENAKIKARAYYKEVAMMTIAIDDGLFFPDLPDYLQPGANVRRVGNRCLDDNEMISYYHNLVEKYGTEGWLTGYFLNAIAVIDGENEFFFQHKSQRLFTKEQSKTINPGYPLASIQIIPKFNKFRSELTLEEEKESIDLDQKEILEFLKKCLN